MKDHKIKLRNSYNTYFYFIGLDTFLNFKFNCLTRLKVFYYIGKISIWVSYH